VGRAIASGHSIVPIELFLNKLGAQRGVDLALKLGAEVVEPIDRARELDEGGAELCPSLAVAEVVLDRP
jgi:hypothetical protein